MNKHFTAKNITKMALLTALLCVSAYITVPMGSIMLTLQTLIVNLIAFLLTPAEAFLTILVYTLLGFCGLPVFSGGAGGPAKLFGPTGGYILGFLTAVPLISFLKLRFTSAVSSLFKNIRPVTARIVGFALSGIIIGMPIYFFLCAAYMSLILDKTWIQSFTIAVLPFIPLDIVKCVLAAIIAMPIERALSH